MLTYAKKRLGPLDSIEDAKRWSYLYYQEVYESWILRLITVWFDKDDSFRDLWSRIKCGWIFSRYIKERAVTLNDEQRQLYAGLFSQIFSGIGNQVEERIGSIHLCELLGGNFAEKYWLKLAGNHGRHVEQFVALNCLSRIGGQASLDFFDAYLAHLPRFEIGRKEIRRYRGYLKQRIETSS